MVAAYLSLSLPAPLTPPLCQPPPPSPHHTTHPSPRLYVARLFSNICSNKFNLINGSCWLRLDNGGYGDAGDDDHVSENWKWNIFCCVLYLFRKFDHFPRNESYLPEIWKAVIVIVLTPPPPTHTHTLLGISMLIFCIFTDFLVLTFPRQKVHSCRAKESASSWHRQWELSKGPVSRSRTVYAKLASNSEPERARVCQRVAVRASESQCGSHRESQRAIESH